MRRRDFLLGGGAIVVSVRAVLAQQPEQLRRIALLGDTPSDWAPWTIAFIGRLRELGWSEGFNIAIDYRWSEARPERLAEIVAELVKHKPDVIVTYGGAVSVLEKATASIPIVFAIAVDPLGVGLVGNLSHPGGNTTGLSLQQTESTGKRLEVLREIVPSLHRLGIMFDGGYRASVEESAQLQLMALKLGLAASPYEIRRAEDIAPAFDVLKGNADALYVAENALTATNRTTIVTLALDTKLPTICTTADFVRAGGLVSYGPDFPALFRRAAEYVDKILRGAKPGDLPVEQPTKFDLVVNLKTAKSLGIEVPNSMQLLADEVIE
jgi:putative tryptophan/tyrosine transport system substrate-binding protein